MDEDALIDDVDARGERVGGVGGGALPVELVAELDLGDVEATDAKLGEVARSCSSPLRRISSAWAS